MASVSKRKMSAVVLILILAVAVMFSLRKKPVRNVLLISIDTCRADRLSCYGFNKKTTPNIDALAGEGMIFSNAISPIALTLPAHCSMLTGTYPLYHMVHDNSNQRLGPENITIAEILKDRDYSTGAIVSAYVLDDIFGLNQGFDVYEDKFENTTIPTNKLERRAQDSVMLAQKFIRENKDNPFFCFLHLYDPHSAYNPPEPFASQYAGDLYSGEIAYVDHCIKQIIDELKSLKLYDSTLIVVVGDHGESFGDHNEAGHGYYVYQSTIRVPFIIHRPGFKKAKKVSETVSLVDVVPTILSYLNIPAPSHVQGKDLSGYESEKSSGERNVFCESFLPTKYGCNPIFAITNNRWKYIDTTKPELYNLSQQPLEMNNIVQKEAKRARLMSGQLQEMMSSLIGSQSSESRLELSDQDIQKLESLGYVGGSNIDTSLELDRSKPDPKDYIQYHQLIEKVISLFQQDLFDEARMVCDQMLEKWSQMPETYYRLVIVSYKQDKYQETISHGEKYLQMINDPGIVRQKTLVYNPTYIVAKIHSILGAAYHEQQQYDKTADHFTESVKLRPNDYEAYRYLAVALFNQNKYDLSIQHGLKSLELNPKQPETHNNLARAYYRKGYLEKTAEHWDQALRLKPDWVEIRDKLSALRDAFVLKYQQDLRHVPDDYSTHAKLAKILYARGKTQDAIEHWYQALQFKPDWPQVHNSLATAHYRNNNTQKAIEHWSVAAEQKPDWAEVYNNLAWVFATAKDDKLRNPQKAINLSEKACQLTGNSEARMLDTLSVAYAADNRYEDAAATAQSAIDLAKSKNQEKLVGRISERLKFYRANKQCQD
jgi:arylsulfatase A-like enzyme/Flp pilus assembly protein TadD